MNLHKIVDTTPARLTSWFNRLISGRLCFSPPGVFCRSGQLVYEETAAIPCRDRSPFADPDGGQDKTRAHPTCSAKHRFIQGGALVHERFPRKRASIKGLYAFWMPAFAGMTG